MWHVEETATLVESVPCGALSSANPAVVNATHSDGTA